MKIGIMSDTHGSLLYFEKALNVLSDCDVLLHGGDVLYHNLEMIFQKDIILKNLLRH